MACSRDTDGDGNCGRRLCPECGVDRVLHTAQGHAIRSGHFIADIADGLAQPEDIDDYVEAWHEGQHGGVGLPEFLGMTVEEYGWTLVPGRKKTEIGRAVIRLRDHRLTQMRKALDAIESFCRLGDTERLLHCAFIWAQRGHDHIMTGEETWEMNNPPEVVVPHEPPSKV